MVEGIRVGWGDEEPHTKWVVWVQNVHLTLVSCSNTTLSEHPNFLTSSRSVVVAVVVELLSRVQLSKTPWAAAHQASLYFTISWTLLKFMPIESVMPSNHLVICCPLVLLPSISPSIRVFSHESALAEFSDFIQECAESDCPQLFLTLFSEAVLIAWNLLWWEHLHCGNSNAMNHSFPPEEQLIKYLAAHRGSHPRKVCGSETDLELILTYKAKAVAEKILKSKADYLHPPPTCPQHTCAAVCHVNS